MSINPHAPDYASLIEPTKAGVSFEPSPPPKLEAVCRAGRWDGCNRCAVRMTAKGSVTPWMACGSRPVKDIPQPGAFPTVGIHLRPGVKGAWPYAPLPPPPSGRLANRPSRQRAERTRRSGQRCGQHRSIRRAVRMTARGAQSRLIANVGREWPEGVPWLAFAGNQGSV